MWNYIWMSWLKTDKDLWANNRLTLMLHVIYICCHWLRSTGISRFWRNIQVRSAFCLIYCWINKGAGRGSVLVQYFHGGLRWPKVPKSPLFCWTGELTFANQWKQLHKLPTLASGRFMLSLWVCEGITKCTATQTVPEPRPKHYHYLSGAVPSLSMCGFLCQPGNQQSIIVRQ